jgi:hypothetical protein
MPISPPEHPPRLALELEGRLLEFVHVDGDLYAAEVDGKRLPIRARSETADVYGSGASHPPGAPTERVGEAAGIDELLRCLELGATGSRVPGGLVFRAIDNWGHFRQNTHLWVRVVLEDEETVLLDVSVGEQDDSYY